MKLPVLIAALVFPILALIGGVIVASQEDQEAVAWDIPVAGRDPLDVLRGHYIIFDFIWPEETTSTLKPGTPSASWRLCLSGAPDNPDIRFFDAGDGSAAGCVSVGRVVEDHRGLRFRQLDDMGLPHADGQLFIAESDGPLLNQLLRNRLSPVKARVRISKDGKVTPVDIIVDGKPYHQAAVP